MNLSIDRERSQPAILESKIQNPKSKIGLPRCLVALLPSLMALLPLWAASAALAGPPGAEGDLYVSAGDASCIHSVEQLDGASGAYVGTFASGGGLDHPDCPRGLTFGPNGNLFVSAENTDEVLEYDGTTGDLIGTFASGGGLDYPWGLTFGPNGNLFVASAGTDQVIEYDGTTGDLVGTFASGGGLDGPTGLTFGPNGNLFVSSQSGDEVIEYDGATGGLIGTFARDSMWDPMGLTFGPNGNLFVCCRRDGVREYDGTTGAFIGVFVSSGATGLTFGPNGNLFVSTSAGAGDFDRVDEYDGTTGELIGTFASGGGLDRPTGLTFGPNGNLFVSSRDTDIVIEYDGATGELIGTFAGEAGLDEPRGLVFAATGNLLVASHDTDTVIEYDGTTGAYLGHFAAAGGLDGPHGLTWGPNGNLFVSSYHTDSVIEFDGVSGAPIGTLASGGGLNEPKGLTFGPNGNLYVVSSVDNDTAEVLEYDGTTGAPIGTFATGLVIPWDLTFGANGNLFVTNQDPFTYDPGVIEFDGTTGDLIGTFASESMDQPTGLVFGPDGSLYVCAGFGYIDDGSPDAVRIINEHYGNSGALVRQFGSPLTTGDQKFLTFKPFAAAFPAPALSGFTPTQVNNCVPLVDAAASGTGLVWGGRLELVRAGEDAIPGAITGAGGDGSGLAVSYDLAGAAPGLWDLVISYPDDQTDTLVDALEILACPPPELTAIDPAIADDCFSIHATITGSGFVPGATSVRLSLAGQPDIEGTNVQVWIPSVIVADFDLTGAAAGLWDLVAANYGIEGDPLVGAVEVSPCPLPEVTGFDPASVDVGVHSALHGATVTGAGFTAGTTVKLTMAGEADIAGTDVAIQSSTTLAADFHLGGAALGLWDVVVTRPDSETATLPGGLTLVNTGVRIRQVGAWGGSVQAISVAQEGDQTIAYIGSGVRLVILDVSDPANIIELGSLMLDAAIMDLEVRDGYAYIGARAAFGHPSPAPGAWFCVVDVHDVTAPFLVAGGIGKDGVGGLFRNLALDGTGRTAYVTPWVSVPQAIDITDPTAPVYIGECGGGSAPVFSGSLMYWLKPGDGYVGTRDMSALPDSCESVLGGYVHIPEYRGAAISSTSALGGDYLYVSANFTGSSSEPRHSLLFVVDFSNLEAPVLAGTWGDPSGDTLNLCMCGRGDVAVSDGRLYWAGWGRDDPLSRTMVILDVATDPANPQLIGEYSSAAEFTQIKVLGTTVYLGDWREGLTILDVSDPANPLRVGNYFSPRDLRQAALEENMLYVTDPSYGVSIVDVSDTQAPALVGQWETGTYTEGRHRMRNWGIAARDGLAYVAAGSAGFQVLNVSDPAAPALAGEFSPWPSDLQSKPLALSPDELIVHLGVHTSSGVVAAWVVNFNVSDLSNIVDVGSVYIGSSVPSTIARRPDGIAYVARTNAVVTVDLAIPGAPSLLGEMGYPPPLQDLAVDGNYLYVVNNSGVSEWAGLDVFSVSGADHLPVPVAHYDFDNTNPEAFAVAVSNGLAYVGAPQLSLSVLDVSDPPAPVPLARTPSAGARINDLIVDGPTVYAITQDWNSAGSAGVLAYQVYALGDFDHDHDVDLRDFAGLQRCFTAGGPIPEDAWLECLPLDFDEDDDVDLDDFAAFVDALNNPPPPPPTGACCLGDGTCTDGVTAASCAVYPLYGQYQGDDTVCAEVTCPPTGACCLPDGTCAEMTLFGCVASDGAYHGDYTDCASVTCPFGACCFIDDGSCLDTSPTACDASGGTYQGDGTTCGLIDCPFGQYSNEIDPITQFAVAGAGLQIADDMTLEGTGARELTCLDLGVYGNGGGAFDVTVELWTDCPGDGGTLIPDTTFTWTAVPDDGYAYILTICSGSPSVTIPDTVWLVATFSTPESGWIIAEQAEVGTTADLYGHNDPPWVCNYYWGGDPYAGLWANLRCVEGSSKRTAGDEQTQLHMIKLEADTPPTLQAVGAE